MVPIKIITYSSCFLFPCFIFMIGLLGKKSSISLQHLLFLSFLSRNFFFFFYHFILNLSHFCTLVVKLCFPLRTFSHQKDVFLILKIELKEKEGSLRWPWMVIKFLGVGACPVTTILLMGMPATARPTGDPNWGVVAAVGHDLTF